ncbi:Uma2 family endonuclease [Streptomyces sp. NPDC018693]|uniref:Uma2 family endonuclease n=1 Tax=unclassified Streptomyces TaxID=2593676 RepID=UPI0037BC9F87
MTLMAERPVISGTEPRSDFERQLDLLDELNLPDGYRAEIIRGNIVVSPWSKGYYTRVMKLVCSRLEPYLPEGHIIERTPQLFVFPGVERACGPDIHAAHERTYETDSDRLDGEGLSFVAELTSGSTRDRDLTDKVDTYGKAGVPVYLVLDMQEQQATVYWAPTAKGYRSSCSMPIGEKLPIPAPFDCILDTDGFEPPARKAEERSED